MKPARYLFLQGQISRFFAELGQSLDRRGHVVHRINFNRGDRSFWTLPGAVDFTGEPAQWPQFLIEHFKAWGVTNLILFGDCRPMHAVAIRLARARGIRVHVFEEGYLRPHFVTMEEGGVNGHSTLPRDAKEILHLAAALPPFEPGRDIPSSFSRRAIEDVHYNLRTALGRWRFPHYQTHRPWHPMREYVVGARRLPAKLLARKQTNQRATALWQGAAPYFLFPLQLDADSQIRFHAPAGGMSTAIATVLQSFAHHAPVGALLVITEHPLDYGPVNLASVIARLVAELGLASRVVFLRDGSPAPLVQAARGLVTVNSTIGITALASGVPVITLGAAIYNLPGLTSQLGIDRFWQRPQPPEPALFEAFRCVVAARTQINGGFYSAQGIAVAVAGAVSRLEHAAAHEADRPMLADAANDEGKALPAWSSAEAPLAATAPPL